LLNSTTISSLIFLLIAVAAWQLSADITESGQFFPRVIAVLMGGLALIQLLISVIQKKKETPFAGIDAKSVLIMVLGISLYVGLIIVFGFILAGIMFLGFFFWYLSRGDGDKSRSVLISFILAALVCGGFYAIFHYIFLVPLPEGIIFGG